MKRSLLKQVVSPNKVLELFTSLSSSEGTFSRDIFLNLSLPQNNSPLNLANEEENKMMLGNLKRIQGETGPLQSARTSPRRSRVHHDRHLDGRGNRDERPAQSEDGHRQPQLQFLQAEFRRRNHLCAGEN